MRESIIGQKSMEFAIRIVKLYRYLVEVKKEFVLSKQLLRSGTSIGIRLFAFAIIFPESSSAPLAFCADIILFVSSIRRALDLAMAMEARCYHGGNRTKLKPLVYRKKDKISY